MSIYITGDTHGAHPTDFSEKLVYSDFQNRLTSKDYLIVCGDFGCLFWGTPNDINKRIKYTEERISVLEKQLEVKSDVQTSYLLQQEQNALSHLFTVKEHKSDFMRSLTREQSLRSFYSNFKCKVLWIDGNHENFDILDHYKEVSWKGGKVHKIGNNVYHLCRGYVFNIDGFKIFTFGGARSHDLMRRTWGITAWVQEMPTEEEMHRGLSNLKANDYKVDLILTHSVPAFNLATVGCTSSHFLNYEFDTLNSYFDTVLSKTDFKCWFSGHYHRTQHSVSEDFSSLTSEEKDRIYHNLTCNPSDAFEDLDILLPYRTISKYYYILKERYPEICADKDVFFDYLIKSYKVHLIYNGIYKVEKDGSTIKSTDVSDYAYAFSNIKLPKCVKNPNF